MTGRDQTSQSIGKCACVKYERSLHSRFSRDYSRGIARSAQLFSLCFLDWCWSVNTWKGESDFSRTR